MAYGQKYLLEFINIDGETIKLVMSELSYEGAVFSIIASADPISMKLDKQGDDRFAPLKPTSISFSFFVNKAGDYDEFYDIDNFQYKVEIFKDNVGIWSGWLNDEVFTEEYEVGKYFVELTATDGMAILKGRYTALNGRVSHMDMIIEAMDAIGLELNIVDALNVSEIGHSTGGALTQTYFDATVFTDEKNRWTLDKVVTDILSTYAANLTQLDNKWVLSTIESYYSEISGFEYTKSGAYVGTFTNADEKDISNQFSSTKVALLKGGSITKNRGWKELRIKRNFGASAPELNINSDFQKTESIAYVPDNSYENPYLFSIVSGWKYSPLEGSDSYLDSGFLRNHPNTGSYLFMRQAENSFNVRSDINTSRELNPDAINTYAFSAKFALLQSGDTVDDAKKWKTAFQVVTSGSSPAYNYYLAINPDTNVAYWTETPTTNLLDNGGDLIQQQNQDTFQWIDIPPIRVVGFPGGKVEVVLSSIHKTGIITTYKGVAWDDVRFYCEASQTGGNGIRIGEPTGNKFTEIPDEIEFTQNDVVTENAEYFYKNYLSDSNGEPTSSWTSPNHSGTLADIYLMAVLEAHGRSVQVKSFPARGWISPLTRFIDENSKKFQTISYSLSLKLNQFDCETVEIIQPGTIPITTNIRLDDSSSASVGSGDTEEPTTGTGSSDDRLVSMLGTNGFETGIPGRLHGNYFEQNYILSNPVYVPKRLSTLKSGKVVLNKGTHNITFTTPFTEDYMFTCTGSTGLAGVNVIIVSDSNYNYATVKVTVDGTTVRWVAKTLDNT